MAGLQKELETPIRQRMGDDLRLIVRLVDAIDRTRAGKHRYVINEIRNAGSA